MFGQPLAPEVVKEGARLFDALKSVSYDACHGWSQQTCEHIAPKTLKINQMKKDLNAVVLAHSYVTPDIVYGVADYRGDSYSLSKWASESKADIIVFAGVVFMAETAKLLNPNAKVFIPDTKAGCSLSDGINAEEVRKLKAEHPGAPVVCYINSSAEVKAESDVCVTSSNVYKIVSNLKEDKVIFVPDRLMAENIKGDPEIYTAYNGIVYKDYSGVLGELDVVIVNNDTNQAVMIGEVKCKTRVFAAIQKARKQLKRFTNNIQSNQIELYLYSDQKQTFEQENFLNKLEKRYISFKGTTQKGFSDELLLTLDSVKYLLAKLKCYKHGDYPFCS